MSDNNIRIIANTGTCTHGSLLPVTLEYVYGTNLVQKAPSTYRYKPNAAVVVPVNVDVATDTADTETTVLGDNVSYKDTHSLAQFAHAAIVMEGVYMYLAHDPTSRELKLNASSTADLYAREPLLPHPAFETPYSVNDILCVGNYLIRQYHLCETLLMMVLMDIVSHTEAPRCCALGGKPLGHSVFRSTARSDDIVFMMSARNNNIGTRINNNTTSAATATATNDATVSIAIASNNNIGGSSSSNSSNNINNGNNTVESAKASMISAGSSL
jgi:hypothetical protein